MQDQTGVIDYFHFLPLYNLLVKEEIYHSWQRGYCTVFSGGWSSEYKTTYRFTSCFLSVWWAAGPLIFPLLRHYKMTGFWMYDLLQMIVPCVFCCLALSLVITTRGHLVGLLLFIFTFSEKPNLCTMIFCCPLFPLILKSLY